MEKVSNAATNLKGKEKRMSGFVNAMNYLDSIKVEDKDISDILKGLYNDICGCSVIGWDIFEIGSTTTNGVPVDAAIARYDFLHSTSNVSVINRRIDYCKSREDVIGKLMDLSLSYEILEARVVKDITHTKAVIDLLLSLDGDGKTNIDADVIQSIADLGSR